MKPYYQHSGRKDEGGVNMATCIQCTATIGDGFCPKCFEERIRELTERLRAEQSLQGAICDGIAAGNQSEINKLRAENEHMLWRLAYYTDAERLGTSKSGFCLNCGAHPETCECGEYRPRKAAPEA